MRRKDSVRKQNARWKAATPPAVIVTPTPHEEMPGIAHLSNAQKAINRRKAEKDAARERVRAILADETD